MPAEPRPSCESKAWQNALSLARIFAYSDESGVEHANKLESLQSRGREHSWLAAQVRRGPRRHSMKRIALLSRRLWLQRSIMAFPRGLKVAHCVPMTVARSANMCALCIMMLR